MIIVELTAGLGNQLFQYAHAKALSIKLDQELLFDLRFFERWKDDIYRLHRFNTIVNSADQSDIARLKRQLKKPDIYRKIIRRLGFSPYKNTKYHFENERLDHISIDELKGYKDLYVSGYFGDRKYFAGIEEIIRKEFTLKEPLNIANQKILDQIKKTNSVSLHIRRGDYVGNAFFAEIPLDYYRKSIHHIETLYPGSTCFIFSDDIPWAREHLIMSQECVYVDINDSSTDYMDLMLMAACKHNIIANSTFSWWGAWLNSNPEKIVIAPKIWFNNENAQISYNKGNLVPDNWVKL